MMELEREAKARVAELGERVEDHIADAARTIVRDAAYAAGRYAADRLEKLIEDFVIDQLYPYRLR